MKYKPSAQTIKLKPCLWDIAVIAAVLLLTAAITVFLASRATGGDLVCTISVEGEEYKTVDLAELPQEGELVCVEGLYEVDVMLTPDGVWVDSAACPNHDCVNTGKITRSGQSIVCLPGRVVIALEAADGSSDFDIIAE